MGAHSSADQEAFRDQLEDSAPPRDDIWGCEDCGWRWPLKNVPWQDSECDACGGQMIAEGDA